MIGLDERLCYLISGEVEFWPSQLKLYNRKTMRTIKMHYPACCCLLEMIRKQPAIVTQNELMVVGWSERKEYVTQNAYYQCILNLRKILGDAGLDENFIRTIHRRGLRIPPNFKIEKISHSNSPDEINEEEKTLPPQNKKQPNEGGGLHLIIKNPRLKIILFFIFQTIIVIYSMVFDIFKPVNLTGDYNFNDYIKTTNISGCTVYTNKTFINKEFFDDIIKKNEISCAEKSWLYITSYPNSQRSSIIQCLGPLEETKKNFCSSYYFYGLK